MNRAGIFAGALLLLTLSLVFFFKDEGSVLPYVPDTAGLPVISVGGTPVTVFIADTEEERGRGLSGREALPPTQGMLFIFQEDAPYRIWMKDMLFPIDILWIDSGGVIVEIKRDVSPSTYPDTFGPPVPVRYILEVPAGFSEQYNVEIGTKVEL